MYRIAVALGRIALCTSLGSCSGVPCQKDCAPLLSYVMFIAQDMMNLVKGINEQCAVSTTVALHRAVLYILAESYFGVPTKRIESPAQEYMKSGYSP
jgi:hypothetical protein